MAIISVVGGAGYVGLAYGVAFAELGHDVVALDIDASKVSALSKGHSPLFEPGLESLLQRGLDNGNLRFTSDYADAIPNAELVFICVGTPSDSAGRAEISYVTAAAQEIGRHARGHTIVVNKSTMPVGSAQLVSGILSEHAENNATFAVVSNPEFLREGSAIEDIFHPDRIVLGAYDPVAAATVAALYNPLGAPVLMTDPCSAEMIKYASNAFLATKISFINEVAMICERLGASVTSVAQGMGMDQRIGSRFLRAGAGFGGSCFPKDVRALASMAHDAGLDTTMLMAVLRINDIALTRVVDKVANHLGGLGGATVGVLGIAFKPETDDVREAPALEVIRQLAKAGARVRATDPVAIRHLHSIIPGITTVEDAYIAATGADAVVLITEWSEYQSLDFNRLANAMRGRLLVDGRNALDPTAVQSAGLIYEGIGLSTPILRPDVVVRAIQQPQSTSVMQVAD